MLYRTLNAHVLAKMEHSTAIMQDAGKAIDQAAKQPNHDGDSNDKEEGRSNRGKASTSSVYDEDRQTNNYNRRKRKVDFHDARQQHGSKGGRGGRDDNKRHKKGDMGRGDYL